MDDRLRAVAELGAPEQPPQLADAQVHQHQGHLREGGREGRGEGGREGGREEW